MRKFFFSLVALFCATVCFAQGSMLATLKHDETITTFYGARALKDAYAAATHGDVITLSSGSFTATDIEKAITIRGAGMGIDTTKVVEPTVISGDFKINITEETSAKFVLEGIYSNNTIRYDILKNAMFLKCRLKAIDGTNNNKLENATFMHCRIAERLQLFSDCSATCVNCAIYYPHSYDRSTSNFEFLNCVVCSFRNCDVDVKSSIIRNSIIISDDVIGRLDSSNSAYNNVAIANSNYFENITNSTNKIATYTDLFKTYTGSEFAKLDNETFELTEEAKTKYLGSDGTEVGIYGGSYPFDSTPTNPQITKCAVASKSTADGKLSVDIQVSAGE
ncbi:MAG: hypothetical protein ACI4BH_09840 [Muribaculaceae bacterium]